MKELFGTLFSGVMASAVAYPLATFVLLGLAPVGIAAIARNIIGFVIVTCGAVCGFATSALIQGTSNYVLVLWGVLWLVSIAFLLFGRPQIGVASASDW
jgi:hypothetical protein